MGEHYQRGEALYDLGRLLDAADEFVKEIGEDPNSAAAWAMHANSLGSALKCDRAEESAKRAIELAPEWEYGYYILSIIKWNQNDAQAAERAAREAIRCCPTEYSWAHLARILYKTGRYTEAIDAARNCLAIDPSYHEATIVQSQSLVQLSLANLPKARNLILNALADTPTDASLLKELASLRSDAAKCDEAIHCYREARRLNPDEFCDDDHLAFLQIRAAKPLRWIDPIFAALPVWTKRNRWVLYGGFGSIGFLIAVVGRTATTFNTRPAFISLLLLANFIALVVPYLILTVSLAEFAKRTERMNWHGFAKGCAIGLVSAISFMLAINALIAIVAMNPIWSFIVTGIAINARYFLATYRAHTWRLRFRVVLVLFIILLPAVAGALTVQPFVALGLLFWLTMLVTSYSVGGASADVTKLEQILSGK
jgi:tetratricopeptide (TPR) repeat protein